MDKGKISEIYWKNVKRLIKEKDKREKNLIQDKLIDLIFIRYQVHMNYLQKKELEEELQELDKMQGLYWDSIKDIVRKLKNSIKKKNKVIESAKKKRPEFFNNIKRDKLILLIYLDLGMFLEPGKVYEAIKERKNTLISENFFFDEIYLLFSPDLGNEVPLILRLK